MTLKQQTVSGIKWLVGTSFINKGISVATTVVLARILNPSIFGLYSLAFIAIDALGLFQSMGFDSALVQRKNDIEKAANTAFFIVPVSGGILYLILSVSAPFIGKFLNNSEVINVVRALGIIFVISCLGKVPAALLEKNMQFKKIAIIEISTSIIYFITAIIFAILGMGIWSLVVAYIIKTLYKNILAFVYSKWLPKFEFDKKIALEMFHFGKFLFLGGIIWFLKMNLDNMLVGKILGITALGFYGIAFNIANFSSDYFGSKVHRVVFPAFSKIQNDKYDLKQAFLKTTKLVGIFAFPLCAILFLMGDELIRLVYGVKWIEAIPVLKVLAFAGLFSTLSTAMGPLFNASGHPKAGFWFGVIQITIFFMFIAPAAKLFGLVGVGIVVTVSALIAVIVYLPFTMKLISLKIADIYLCLKPGLASSLLMGLGIILLKYIFLKCSTGSYLYYNLTALVIFAGLVYSLSLFKIERNILKEIKHMMFTIS